MRVLQKSWSYGIPLLWFLLDGRFEVEFVVLNTMTFILGGKTAIPHLLKSVIVVVLPLVMKILTSWLQLNTEKIG